MRGAEGEADDSIRLDKLLFFLRLSRSRLLAQQLIAGGTIRVDGRRVDKPGTMVRAGAMLVLPINGTARALRLLAIPRRRGPAAEARTCYADAQAEAGAVGTDRGTAPLTPPAGTA